MKNRLIVFEGIDGTGKTTLSKRLVKELKALGIPAIRYESREKKNSGFNILKPFIKKNTPINASLFFYIASAIYKSAAIESLLKKSWVICDRYVYSTLADHAARGANLKLLPLLRQLPIRLPDYYFLLTTKETVRMARIKSRLKNNPNDFLPNRKGSALGKTEKNLRKYRPIIINNSAMDIAATLKSILKILKK